MAQRLPLSAIVISLNEEHNIARCLRSLAFAAERIVVDSGSTDRTREIATSEGALVLTHAWEGYGQQKNWAMGQAGQPWLLFVDADEEVSPELAAEISAFVLEGGRGFAGAHFPRKTRFLGRWILHGGWYPNRLTRLVKKEGARWTEPAVHEALVAGGNVLAMKHDLLHYTFRELADQVRTNLRFAHLGAQVARDRGEHGTLAKVLLKPVFKFLETYVWKRGFLDGFPGFVISINAAHSIFLKYAELRLEENPPHR